MNNAQTPNTILFFSITAIIAGIVSVLGGIALNAQIYPVRSDLQRAGLSGPVSRVVETSRSWSPELSRWNPLVMVTVMNFSPEGRLNRKFVTMQNRPVDKSLFIYDSASGMPEPIIDVTVEGSDISERATPVSEEIYTYDDGGRSGVIIGRDFRLGRTTITQHVYDTKGRLKLRVTSDSAEGYILEIEEFYWTAENRPTGSVIRKFDPATDPFRSLRDTAKVPVSRVGRDYTSFGYKDTTHPVIWFHWELGRDTIVDRQEFRRFDAENNLFSTLMQRYESGSPVQMQARIYNPFGDILSSADSFGDATTYERAFDYIYDARDEQGNWRTRRQYVMLDPEAGSDGERVLLSRTDRGVEYY